MIFNALARIHDGTAIITIIIINRDNAIIPLKLISGKNSYDAFLKLINNKN